MSDDTRERLKQEEIEKAFTATLQHFLKFPYKDPAGLQEGNSLRNTAEWLDCMATLMFIWNEGLKEHVENYKRLARKYADA